MNYREKHPTFSFRIDPKEKRKLDKLAYIKKISTNEFARQILTKFLNDDLVEKTEDLQKIKMQLQIKKLEAEIAEIVKMYHQRTGALAYLKEID